MSVKITCRSSSSRNHRSSTVTGLWFYLVTSRAQDNFLYFEKRGFGEGGI